MALHALRLRRSLSLSSALLNHLKSPSPTLSLPALSSPAFANPSLYVNGSNPKPSFQTRTLESSSILLSPRHNSYNSNVDSEKFDENTILFEGCDYNHWLITMDFPKDPKPSAEDMVETYVQTAAKVVGSVEEAKKKIYACSTTTYQGFQIEVSEEEPKKFEGLPGVVFVLPDSYIDPVNKEYGGDKYINGTIIPRPPPIQYARQSRRYDDRNREYARRPRGQTPLQNYGDSTAMNNASGGQGNYQGERRDARPPYQGNYNQGHRSYYPPGQMDSPPYDRRNHPPPEQQRDLRGDGRSYEPPQRGNYGQGAGQNYGQGAGQNYGQGAGQNYGQGAGQNYGQGASQNYGQGASQNCGPGVGQSYGPGQRENVPSDNYGSGPGPYYGAGQGGNYGQALGRNDGPRAEENFGHGGSRAPAKETGFGYCQNSTGYRDNQNVSGEYQGNMQQG